MINVAHFSLWYICSYIKNSQLIRLANQLRVSTLVSKAQKTLFLTGIFSGETRLEHNLKVH